MENKHKCIRCNKYFVRRKDDESMHQCWKCFPGFVVGHDTKGFNLLPGKYTYRLGFECFPGLYRRFHRGSSYHWKTIISPSIRINGWKAIIAFPVIISAITIWFQR